MLKQYAKQEKKASEPITFSTYGKGFNNMQSVDNMCCQELK